jgi:hypothetical protein
VSEANFAQNSEAQRSFFLLFIDKTILAKLANINALKTNDPKIPTYIHLLKKKNQNVSQNVLCHRVPAPPID